jgi:tyrosine decarboxylase / aspartate 1-decarboxylase
MTLETKSVVFLKEALDVLESGFSDLPPFDPSIAPARLREVLLEVAAKMRDNFPYPHPFYIGQMMKPPHPIARLAYTLSLWINPNNHALDGGRASSAMEKEVVSEIAGMFGWETHLGHLTSGGTMANLEGLWVSARLNPGKMIVASQQAHYTHKRLCGVLGIPFREVACDDSARMSVDELEKILKQDDVGTVVVTVGTTATGSVDPHKHGLQPYGCGCVLFKDPTVGRLYKHESPYTYFSSNELHLGEISLECSRPGSSAAALWATQRMLPLIPGGQFAQDLGKCRRAALKLFDILENDSRFMTAFPPELDIVVWAPKADSAGEASVLSDAIFEEAAHLNLYMAKVNLPRTLFQNRRPQLQWDQDHVTCLRTCLMKPEHLDWMDQIWGVLDKAADTALKKT